MKKLTTEDPETKSADVIAENIARLRELFPEAFIEGKVDFEVLKQLLGGVVEEREAKFGLNWFGKREARQLSLIPSTGTLRPCREESVDWDKTQNLIIEGDNLEVLKLLQKSYAGRVKVIYIDPPYNTGQDFVYPDQFQDSIRNYLELTGQVEGGAKISSNTEASGRFHTAWLNMMYPRLRLARDLLSEDGVIFVSIDDREVGHLQAIMCDIFGEENFQANVSWQKRYTRSNNTVDFTTMVEHILVFSRSPEFVVNLLQRTEEADARYSNPDNDPRGPWKGASFLNPATPDQRPNLCYPIRNPNTREVTKPTTNAWRRSRAEFESLQQDGRLYWGADGRQPVPVIKMFLSEARNMTPANFWAHDFAGNTDDGTRDLKELMGAKVFDNPKPVQLIERVLEHGSSGDSIILDFFAGSGTTAEAVMRRNVADKGRRRFVLVQLPEPLSAANPDQKVAADFCEKSGLKMSLAEITKERVRRAGQAVQSSAASVDVGFRVFKLSSSNIREWDPNPSQLAKSLEESVEHLKTDRTEEDILYELLLKLGLDLCVPMESKKIAGAQVYAVGGGVLLACLAEKVSKEKASALAEGLVAWHKLLKPAGNTICIFRDSAFIDDVAKTNLAAILHQNGLTSVRSI